MKRKLLFITLLMLFCSTMFGQQHWQMTEADIVNYNLTMTVYADVTFNTDPLGDLDETKYEIAAFHNGVLRGVATPTYSEILKRYIFQLIVHSKEIGQTISFKFFNPKEGPEGTVYNTDYTVNFSNATVGLSLKPITIDFYEPHFDFDAPSSVENYMGFGCAVKIDGVEQNRPNLEIAAINENGEVCGYARSQALVGTNIYIFPLQIYAQNGETISFKLFDPTIGEDGDVLLTDYTIEYDVDYDSESEVEYIDFRNEAVAQIGNNYYDDLSSALKAITSGCTLDILTDITIASDWDCRNTGAKIGVPVTINGNGKTIKFTGKISDGYNHLAAFRFEAPVTVENLIVDMSEAEAVFQNRFSAISTKANLTVNGSKFIGSTTYSNSRAIIYGEGGHKDLEVTVTNTEFINWKYGVVDNMNGGDVKSVIITGNTFNNADVQISAYESITFKGNDTDSDVQITSYTADNTLNVTAIENDLAADGTYTVNAGGTLELQDEFLTPVADVNGKIYFTLQEALDYAVTKGGDVTVKLLDDINLEGTTWTPVYFNSYPAENTNTLIIDGNNKTISNLSDMLFSKTWTGTKLEVKNLTISKAEIKHDVNDATSNVGVGAVVGSIGATDEVVFDNVDIVDSYVEGGHWTGGLIGYAAGYSGNDGPVFTDIVIKNCEISGSIIVGKGSVGGVVGHAAGDAWTSFDVKTTSVTDNTITSTGSSNNKAGIVMGTIGTAGQEKTTNGITHTGGVFVSVEETGNTAKSHETIITTIYGRQGSEDGVLTLTEGGSYQNNPIEENVTYAVVAPGFKLEANDNGTYGVVVDLDYGMVARIGETRYETIAAALAATTDNATVTIIKSTNETIGVPAGNNVTITALKGVKLSGGVGGSYYNKSVTFDGLTFNGGKGMALTANVAGLKYTVKNCTFDGVQATAYKQGVISLNGNATVVVENNTIINVQNATEGDDRINTYGQQSAGIYTNNATAVTISGNEISGVDGTGISSNSNAGKVDITNNIVSNWGTGATAKNEGRAIRTSGGTEVAITGNVMIDEGTAKEEFVKSETFTSLDASGNYWDGKSPLEDNMFATDVTSDPALILKNYYKDQDKDTLVVLPASVAKIEGKYYQSLQTAIDAATNGQTVTIVINVNLNNTLTVAADKNFILDLNGKTITGTPTEAVDFAVITNKGNLTITDDTETKEGKILCEHELAGSTAYAVNTITNSGTLTIEAGTIGNTSTAISQIGYAIDNNSTTGSAVVVIKGGNVTASGSNYYDGIRQFCNSETNENSVTIEGGEVSTLWIQNPSDNNVTAVKGSFAITGGTLGNLYLEPSANFSGSITAGHVVKISRHQSGDNDIVDFITGGTFGMDVTEFCAFNYVCTPNENGTYGVEYKEQVEDAFVISNLHELIAFRNAVNAGNTFEGQTVVLSNDVDLNPSRAIENWIPIGTSANPFKGTFDGGNFTISNLYVVGENNVGLFGYADNATIENVKIKNANVKGTDCVGAIAGQVYSTSLINNCHVSGSIQVEGQTNVGGIVGKYYTKVTNSSVIGDGVATSYVKGVHKEANLEGDNIGGIMGHGGENNTFTNNTVKNITISGTRKVGGIVGVTDQNTDVTNCLVENVNIETTAKAEYAQANAAKAGHASIVGSYTKLGANNNGTVTNCVVKNVTFVNNDNVTMSAGPITGGAREGMVDPTGVTASGNLIYMSTITGSNNLYLMNAVAQIGETKYYTLQEAVDAGNGVTVNVILSTAEDITIAENADITLTFADDVTLNGYIAPFNGNLTVDGGTINNTNGDYSAIEITAGKLNLNNVNISSARHAVRIDGAVTAEVNGGNYTLNTSAGLTQHAFNISGAANVTINNGKFVGPAGTSSDSGAAINVKVNSTVVINGGDFSGGKLNTLSSAGTLIVKGGTYDQDPSAYLAEGYVAIKNGNVWTVGLGVAKLNNVTYVSLQEAIDAATEGNNKIELLTDITDDVTVSQQEGVDIVIDGKKAENENYKFNGTIYVNGNSRHEGKETLTIQYIDFNTEENSHDFISCNSGGDEFIRYAHNVTVMNCNFTATESSDAVVAMRFRQSYNIKVIGGTFNNLHSVMWTTGGTNINVNGIVANNCKEGGLSLGTTTNLTVENAIITGTLYGIRLGGGDSTTETLGGPLTVSGSTITAQTPILARNANSTTTFTFNGTNTMSETNTANDYWCIICDGNYNGEETPTYPKGQVTVVLNDTGLSYDGVYGNYGVAKIGNAVYTTLADAYNAATEDNNTIELLADVTIEQTIAKPITIDGNGNKLSGNVLITSDVTFAGELELANNVKVTNGAKLTIAEGAVVTGAETFFGAGADADYYGMSNSETFAGTILINGTLDIQQINANNAGVVNVAQNAKLTVDIVCAENGNMENAVAGVMNIDGNVTTQRFNIFGGSTVNVNATGIVSSEQEFTSANMDNVISIWGGAELHVSGTVTCATVEHTDARHSKVSVAADGVLVVNKDGKFTCGGELNNAGELKVVLDCTTEAQSLTGNGKVTIDATAMTASEGLAVKADVEGFNGEITVVGGSYEKTAAGIYVRRTTEIFYTAEGVETTADAADAAYSLMFTITDDANKEVSVKIGSKKPANNSNATLVIPAQVGEYNVTAIEESAFHNCYNFSGNLEIPASVKTIGKNAFSNCYYQNTVIGTLTLNEGIESIGDNAFTGAKFTGNLSIPSTVKSVGTNAFQNATFDGTLTINCDNATFNNSFSGTGITEIVIAEGIKIIGPTQAFAGMQKLETVTIPLTLESLGQYPFNNSTMKLMKTYAVTPPTYTGDNNYFSTEDVKENAVLMVFANVNNYVGETENWGGFKNVIGIGSELEIAGKDDKYTMIATITSMDPMECSIKIGNTKPAANSNAELVIPETVDFADHLQGYDFNDVKVTSIPYEAFSSTHYFVGNLTIPQYVRRIEGKAFHTCYYITNSEHPKGILTLNDNLKYIGAQAFTNSYFDNGLSIPASVNTIAGNAFQYAKIYGTLTINCNVECGLAFSNSELTKIVVSDGVTKICANAFNGMVNVKEVVLPSTLTEIGLAAFSGANSIDTVMTNAVVTVPTIIYQDNTDYNKHPFSQTVRDNATLWVVGESYDDVLKYKADAKWNEFANIHLYGAQAAVEAEDYYYEYLTFADAYTAATSGQTITLFADVDLTETLAVDKNVTLNLNGNDITADFENSYGAIYVKKGAELTIEGEGNITSEGIAIGTYGTVNIKGGNITTRNTDIEEKATALYVFYYQSGYEGTANISGGSLNAVWNCGTLNISGGHINYLDTSSELTVSADVADNSITKMLARDGSDASGAYKMHIANIEAFETIEVPEGYELKEVETGVYQVVLSQVTQTTQLGKGWNWFSYYVETDFNALKTALGENGSYIKEHHSGGFAQYYPEAQYWYGEMTLTPTRMYYIETSNMHELNLQGLMVDTENCAITIKHNWNAIGYYLGEEQLLNDALKSLNPVNGDYIKSKTVYATYYEGYGWYGELQKMIPGEGYFFQSASEKDRILKYSYLPAGSKSELRANVTTDGNHWVPTSGQYANNMTMTAMVNVEGSNYEIAAFVGGECRGSARPIYVDALDSYMFFLTIHGDEVEEMSFRLYDTDTDTEYMLNDRINYSNDAIVGSLTEPYMFNLEMLGIGENSAENFNIYPNPTTTNAEINLNATCEKVEVFNALGIKVAEYSNVDTIDALETAGIYVIRVTNDNNVKHCRLIVK